MSSRKRTRNPRSVFLADQAAAAAEQLQGYVRDQAAEHGATVRHDRDHPVVERLTQFFKEWVEYGEAGMCEHLDPGAPRMACWLSSQPENPLCSDCFEAAVKDLVEQLSAGKAACHHCGATGSSLQDVWVALEHILLLGLSCPGCMALDASSPGGVG